MASGFLRPETSAAEPLGLPSVGPLARGGDAASAGRQRPTDVRIVGAELYFLPVETRTPLKFGGETLTTVTCARARLTVTDRAGRSTEGWGETPLSVEWAWPSRLPYAVRHEAMLRFCRLLTEAYAAAPLCGHALEIGDWFTQHRLPELMGRMNAALPAEGALPLLAALVCSSPFDLALHDAYGRLADRPVYETYGPEHLNYDLSRYLRGADDAGVDFRGRYPADFLTPPRRSLPVWHLVGGLDPLTAEEADGAAPRDGHPRGLDEWIERDGLKCLKIKLRGDDAAWDYERVVRVWRIAAPRGVERLTTDFNCTVRDPGYVLRMLDRWRSEEPALYDAISYVEQPFPHDLEAHPIQVSPIARQKPLLMDESADSWSHVALGRTLGWNGVALKTCKTQSGALLSLSWAKAHGMHVMVQDLTNPMLAQIPHVLLAAHAGTLWGVESNAMQFYPEASAPEAAVHPGLYRRRGGELDLSTIRGPGFGYRLAEIERTLPPPAATCPARRTA